MRLDASPPGGHGGMERGGRGGYWLIHPISKDRHVTMWALSTGSGLKAGRGKAPVSFALSPPPLSRKKHLPAKFAVAHLCTSVYEGGRHVRGAVSSDAKSVI